MRSYWGSFFHSKKLQKTCLSMPPPKGNPLSLVLRMTLEALLHISSFDNQHWGILFKEELRRQIQRWQWQQYSLQYAGKATLRVYSDGYTYRVSKVRKRGGWISNKQHNLVFQSNKRQNHRLSSTFNGGLMVAQLVKFFMNRTWSSQYVHKSHFVLHR